LADQAAAAAAILVVGSASALGAAFAAAAGGAPTVVVGPRASEAPFATRVAIDTGVAGIHEEGIAYRMDDVPLPLRPPLGGPPRSAEVLARLLDAARSRGGGRQG
jgi:formylmethanofuran dehydrogenase subunit B